MSEVPAKIEIPSGVRYDWNANDDTTLDAIHVYGGTFAVNHQLPAEIETPLLLRASGMELASVSSIVGGHINDITHVANAGCDVLHVPKKPKTSRIAAAVGRLCVPSGILHCAVSIPKPDVLDEKCLQMLALLGQGMDWRAVSAEMGYTHRATAMHYFKKHYDPMLTGERLNTTTLLLHAYAARILDPAHIVAKQGGNMPLPPYTFNWKTLREGPRIRKPVALSVMSASLGKQSTPAVEPGIAETERPFSLVDENERRMFVRATRTGEVFSTTLLLGKILLTLKVGVKNGMTQEELRHAISHTDPWSFHVVLQGARRAIRDRGPNLITASGHSGTKTTYYYAETPSEAPLQRFETGTDVPTHLRLDKRTGCLTISQGNAQRDIKIVGDAREAVVVCLLNHPGAAIPTAALDDALMNAGCTDSSVGGTLLRLRNYLAGQLGESFQLITTRRQDTRYNRQGSYTLEADTVEIIEDDGSLRTIHAEPPPVESPASTPIVQAPKQPLRRAPKQPRPEKSPVQLQHIANVALGIILCQDDIRKLQAIRPTFGSSTHDFTFLAETMLGETTTTSATPKEKIITSLEKLKTFLDSSEGVQIIQEWSPLDANLKSFVAFLAKLHNTSFPVRGGQIKGIDMVLGLMRQRH